MHAVAEENSLYITNNIQRRMKKIQLYLYRNIVFIMSPDIVSPLPSLPDSDCWLRDNFRMAGLTFNKKMQGQLAARKFIL